jgi:hypothetical protein
VAKNMPALDEILFIPDLQRARFVPSGFFYFSDRMQAGLMKRVHINSSANT